MRTALCTILSLVTFCVASAQGPEQSDVPDFNTEIFPLLSDRCFTCHGPDAAARKANLRLDTQAGALEVRRDGRAAVVPGSAATSLLVQRIRCKDPKDRMPPPESHKSLNQNEIDLLVRWIDGRAPWESHWSFEKLPSAVPVPSIDDAWVRNKIDSFVLERLRAEGLSPSREASPRELVRRVSLDLRGLPPTPGEVNAFLSDSAPGAYERMVDHFFASPHYGERLAIDWLDAARYADTHGYHYDNERTMWPWRDWVIDAFNANMPYDQFTLEQLAGDLLPNPSQEQLTATGFHRNHPINWEGGIIPEEYRTEYVIDRTSTTGTVWLGLTLGCARCHDHKYDPISQREFFELSAFFNQIDEKGQDGKAGNAEPMISVPDGELRSEMATAESRRRELMAKKGAYVADRALVDRQEKWLAKARSELLSWSPLTPIAVTSDAAATKFTIEPTGSVFVEGPQPDVETYEVTAITTEKGIRGLRLEALSDPRLPDNGPGRASHANYVLSDFEVDVAPVGAPYETKEVVWASIVADYSQPNFGVSQLIDDDPKSGWAIMWYQRGETRTAILHAKDPFGFEGGTLVRIRLHFQSTYTQHGIGRFRVSYTTSGELPKSTESVDLAALLARETWNEQETQRLRDYFWSQHSPELARFLEELRTTDAQLKRLQENVPTVMVLRNLEEARPTWVLNRGQYDQPTDRVSAATPEVLPPMDDTLPRNRLGLAQWLVHPDHPLTARVTVNRCWQLLFGQGLVSTVGDFGLQGERPLYPQLLDWLARDFVASGWDVRRLLRQMILSATYRQSSRVTALQHERDPENRFLGRGARYRLPAEFVRDQALAVSGLLVPDIGGASVKPYQPPGLWKEVGGGSFSANFYEVSQGEDLYRRSLYTFWKRSLPPPALAIFDAPTREICTVRRQRTNTPLQALVLLNDDTFVEAARKLAEAVVSNDLNDGDTLDALYQRVLGRDATDGEREEVLGLLATQREAYRKDPTAANRLLGVGESAVQSQVDPGELAAWSVVASVLLNLDETITRG